MRVVLLIGVSMKPISQHDGEVESKRNQNSQLRRCRVIKTVLTHVALCGLEAQETQQTTRFLIGSPEEYVHGHTLSIVLTQMIGVTSAGEGRLTYNMASA